MSDFKIREVLSIENFISSVVLHPMEKIKATETFDGGKTYHGVTYYNVPCSFDIETSSFYYNDTKCACMYIWQFGINGFVTYGRTWKEFDSLINALKTKLHLTENKRLVCYVHNLSFEFQWIRKRFEWLFMFAREERNPMKAITTNGLEFRCSYMLSGCSLEQTCKDLTKYKVEKKVGDLDYRLVRTPVTPISEKELNYAVYDVIGVMCYIQEEIEIWGDISKIPLTKTSKVRKYCRNYCFNNDNGAEYKNIMSRLKIYSVEEYEMLKRAFTAGYTHANYHRSAEIWENVQSMDFTSSYPAVMVCEKHPMSSGQWVKAKTLNQIRNLAKNGYYIIFNVQFGKIAERENIPDHYISTSRCYNCLNIKSDNGRLISADRIEITITSDDLEIIDKCYDFKDKDCIIGRVIRYELGYLPRAFVECVLTFYKDKTTLKDIENMISEYALKKGMLNSTFGCCVTDICSDDIAYDDEWITKEGNPEEMIEDYNNSKSRFLFYPWGISICSRARKNLWNGILSIGEDYIYSDTDSIKFINPEKHAAYFEQYNKEVTEKMRIACEQNRLNYEDTHPKTKDGKEKPLGVWDYDGKFRRFKTLGAKRYLVEYWKKDEEKDIVDEEGNPTGEKEIIPAHWEIKATISGASKKKASEYIAMQKEPFNFFTHRMSIPCEYSGRLTHFYIDDPRDFECVDYMGNYYKGSELSGVHLEESEYNLTISPVYMLLLGLTEEHIL